MRRRQVCNVCVRGFLLPDPHGFPTSPRCSSSLNCTITNIKKRSVYSNTGNVSEHVGWIRRELLLKKASSGDVSRVPPLLSELQSGDLQRIVQWLPRSTVVDGTSSFFVKSPHSPCETVANRYIFSHDNYGPPLGSLAGGRSQDGRSFEGVGRGCVREEGCDTGGEAQLR